MYGWILDEVEGELGDMMNDYLILMYNCDGNEEMLYNLLVFEGFVCGIMCYC